MQVLWQIVPGACCLLEASSGSHRNQAIQMYHLLETILEDYGTWWPREKRLWASYVSAILLWILGEEFRHSFQTTSVSFWIFRASVVDEDVENDDGVPDPAKIVWNLKRRQIHGAYYECKICNEKFTRDNYLIKHMAKHGKFVFTDLLAGWNNQLSRCVRSGWKPHS